jgi:hypothetical protein|tara:strand:+ start:718 stop:1011 length:294 start_codon:yes stop_codon:yes gene_type:complete
MPENYTFVSRGKEKWASIMLTNGEYEGVIYQYGKVSVPEGEDENGNMPLSFKYNIVDYNGHDEEDLESSKDFKNTLGDILVEILDEQLEASNFEYND